MYSMTSLDWSRVKKRGAEPSILDDVRFTVFRFVNRVTLLRKSFHEGGSCMGWVGVVDHHVFRLTGFGEFKNFLMPGMG
jgi:hypothetical protein